PFPDERGQARGGGSGPAIGAPGGDDAHAPVLRPLDHADLPQPSGAVGGAADVQHHLDGGGQLAVQGGAGQTAEGGEGFQTGGDLARGIGVDGTRATVVAGVERGEQVDDLSPADLAHDDAVGAHAQGLPNQVADRHLTDAFHIGGAGDQAHDVRVGWGEFGGVLDADDAFGGIDRGQQARQQGGL